MAQIKLKREWEENRLVHDIFVIDAGNGRTCSSSRKDAEPLFTYDWHGFQPFYVGRVVGSKTWYSLRSASFGESFLKNAIADAGFPMLQATTFLGKQICAVKSKSSFKDIRWQS